MSADHISIVIPAKNESGGLKLILPELVRMFPVAEIIVVNDASTDDTAEVAARFGAIVITSPYSQGNGAAIKNGARHATKPVIVFMDGDGQHRPEDIVRLLAKFDEGFDMVVGARSRASQAGMHRAVANGFYNIFATWMVGQTVEDLTSGLRVVRASKFRRFLYLLPNGFSYPTTITMSFFRAGYTIAYLPIVAPTRIGKSHIRIFRDGARFFLIIFKIGTLFAPLKLFLPVSGAFFVTACSYYLYTYITAGRFTNMSALLFITSILVFLMGLISEQISALNYKESES